MRVLFDIDSPVTETQLRVLTRALVALNVDWLRQHPQTPTLRESGVRYRTQDHGFEFFKMIPDIIAAGSGDCDQLTAWRCAELRVRHGIRALPEIVRISSRLFHCYVKHPNGKAEDISAHLGMRVPPKFAAAGRALIARDIRQRLAARDREKHAHERRRFSMGSAPAAWSPWFGQAERLRRL